MTDRYDTEPEVWDAPGALVPEGDEGQQEEEDVPITETEAMRLIASDVAAVSRTVALSWSGVIEADDLIQDTTVLILEGKLAARLFRMAKPDKRRFIRTKAVQAASAQAARYDHFTGGTTYGTKEVRSLLSQGVLTEQATKVSADRMDLLRSFEKLTERQRTLISDRYVMGVEQDNAARARLSQAVDKLTEWMNRTHVTDEIDHDGPGGRKAVSNNTAVNTLGWNETQPPLYGEAQ